MKEQNIQSKIIKYLQARGAYVINVMVASRSGVPDVLACYRGRFIAFEVKRPGQKPSALQRENIAMINQAEGMAAVVTSIAEVKAVLDAEDNS